GVEIHEALSGRRSIRRGWLYISPAPAWRVGRETNRSASARPLFMDNHVILCGLGRVGWHALEFLQAAGTPVVVIDTRCPADDPRLAGVTLVQGDCQKPATLEKAGLATARGVAILPSDDLVSTTTALMIRRLNPIVSVVVRWFNVQYVDTLAAVVLTVVPLR